MQTSIQAWGFRYEKRDIRIFDQSGKELTGNNVKRADGTEHEANWIPNVDSHGSSSRATAELELLDGFGGLILIIGLIIAGKLWKREAKGDSSSNK